MNLIYLLVVLLTVSFAVLITLEIKRKNIHIWILSYLTRRTEDPAEGEPIHIIFAFCDHFEPKWHNPSYEAEVARVDHWCNRYRVMAGKHKDADGCFPKHTFFYPQEEYRKEHLDKLASLCKDGFGEIEVHIHHRNDTAEGLSKTINSFLATLDTDHQAVPKNPDTGQLQFAFIHGNWALDNSRKDGDWCGVNNELSVLSKIGCYADFTLPSAPSDTQTRKINSIYYATGIDGKSKSHDFGKDLEADNPQSGDLVLIQGPLCLNWKDRKFGILPKIENSDIRHNSPPSQHRVDMWIQTAITVKKQPQWRFVKIHTHGAQDIDMDTLLGEPTASMFEYLETKYNDGQQFVLHYVSAREMYNIAKAAESNKRGNPHNYRDFIIPKPKMLED